MGASPSKPDPSRYRMQVIGASFSRTGTTSLQMALERLLDGPVQHGGTFCMSDRGNDWNLNYARALEAKLDGDKERSKKFLKRVMDGFVGCTEFPGNEFVPEMLELYPDAKVVLVERDPIKWWPSMAPLVKQAASPILPILAWPCPGFRWFPKVSHLWQVVQERRLAAANKDWGPDVIRLHGEEVINNVPKDKLLVMKLGDGWEPLCKFLGKPIPDEPFPRANDAEAAGKVAAYVMGECLLRWIVLFSTAAAIPYLINRFYPWSFA